MTFLYRLIFWNYRMASGWRYRVRRRMMPAGWMVAAGLGVAVLTGFDTDNTVTYQCFPVLLLMLTTAVAFSWFFRARFSATRVLPRFGTAGHPFYYRVVVKNLTRKVQRGLTLLENPADPRPKFREWLPVQLADERRTPSFHFIQRRRANPFRLATVKDAAVPTMRPNEEAEASLELIPLRRGVLRLEAVTLARPDPLGLVRALARVRVPQSVLILPKRYVLPPFALPGARKYQQGGVALASAIGRSDEFVSLRDYRRGDPYRHIHWRSWAKASKPIVKEFEDEFFVRHALVLDTFAEDPRGDAFEEAVSVAASFACTLPTQESLLDLLFVGPQAYCFTAGRGLAHADQMLEILASVRACAGAFSDLESLVLQHVGGVSGCICVLLAWDDARQKLVEKLKLLGVPLLVLIVVEAGGKKTFEPGPLRDEPESFHVLTAGEIEEGLARL